MPIGILTAFALPAWKPAQGAAPLPPGAEHTYVTSSGGHFWPCRGRANGGRQICSGNGNIDKADCRRNPIRKPA